MSRRLSVVAGLSHMQDLSPPGRGGCHGVPVVLALRQEVSHLPLSAGTAEAQTDFVDGQVARERRHYM